MKTKLFTILMAAVFVLFSCKSKDEKKIDETAQPETEQTTEVADAAHNSMNSLDWAGTYTGTTPCADCPGIDVELTINDDLTYEKTMDYQERDTKVEEKGTFKWDDSGQKITLYIDGETTNQSYFIGENRIWQLDMEGNRIEGDLADYYILEKVTE